MESDTEWMRTDLHTKAVRGLETCRRHLEAGKVDAYELKWAALALTTSLQAFIMCTYRSIEIIGWHDRTRREFNQWYEGDLEGDAPKLEPRVPPFMPLCAKLRDERGWEPSDGTWQRLKQLRDLRDAFMHFKPRGWSIEAAYLRESIAAGLEAVAHVLANRPGTFLLDEAQTEAAARELELVQRLLR